MLRRRNCLTGTPIPDCMADLTGDDVVDTNDLLAMLAVWGTADVYADIAPGGGDGVVDVNDLLALIGAWGDCP